MNYTYNNQVNKIVKNEGNIILKIKNLQNIEKNLYNDLVDPSLNEKRRIKIIEQINKLTLARIDLYENLTNTYGIIRDSVNNTRNDLVNQKTILKYMEDELNKKKNDLSELEKIKNNKLRMVQINTYNAKRYNSLNTFARIFFIVLFIIYILMFVVNKSILPINNTIFNMLLILIITSFSIWSLIHWYRYMYRDNMNWDKYNWGFNESTIDTKLLNNQYQQQKFNVEKPFMGCIGELCCSDDTIWDAKTKKCIGGYNI